MIDFEQTAGDYSTLGQARIEGQKMCDAEPIPSVWTITDVDGNEIEPISRSDGKTLSDQIASFNAKHLVQS